MKRIKLKDGIVKLILIIFAMLMLNFTVFGFITPDLISAKSTALVYLGFCIVTIDLIVTILLIISLKRTFERYMKILTKKAEKKKKEEKKDKQKQLLIN